MFIVFILEIQLKEKCAKVTLSSFSCNSICSLLFFISISHKSLRVFLVRCNITLIPGTDRKISLRHYSRKTWCSSVGVVSRLQAENREFVVQFVSGQRGFSFLRRIQTDTCVVHQPPISVVFMGVFWGGQATRGEADLSLSSSDEVKNECSCTSAPTYAFRTNLPLICHYVHADCGSAKVVFFVPKTPSPSAKWSVRVH